uniref:Serine/threonine-protein kinase-transforming protein raf n=1 Tax=Rhizophora mucronata TaxID=61149 RepID=A0A2P2KB00_RHIMU
MAREQIRGVEGQSMRSSNSFELSIVHPETEMGPEVR